MEINGYRTLTDSLNGTHNAAALGAVNKMFWSEFHRQTMELAISILGLEGQILTGSGGAEADVGGRRSDGPLGRRGSPGYPVSPLQASYFFSVSETIWGGTAEIQRNIVGGAGARAAERAEALRHPQATRARHAGSLRPRLIDLELVGLPALIALAPRSRRRCASSIALAPIADAAPMARATLGLAAWEIHPTSGPPSGAVPRNPIAYRAITRPRIGGSTRIWIVELAVAMNAIESAAHRHDHDRRRREGSARVRARG